MQICKFKSFFFFSQLVETALLHRRAEAREEKNVTKYSSPQT